MVHWYQPVLKYFIPLAKLNSFQYKIDSLGLDTHREIESHNAPNQCHD